MTYDVVVVVTILRPDGEESTASASGTAEPGQVGRAAAGLCVGAALDAVAELEDVGTNTDDDREEDWT